MKKVKFSITIKASKELVWKVLWEDAKFRDWANIIDEGLYLKGELKEGKEIEFISSANGYGVKSLVEKYRPNEYVSFRHKADTQANGEELRDNEWSGGTESYSLIENEGITTLILETDLPKEQEETFKNILPKALERIKMLSEEN